MVRVAWNKGLTKEIDERVAKLGINTSITRKKKCDSGEIKSWAKGLTAETDVRIASMAEKRKGKKHNISDETKQLWTLQRTGRKSPMKGHNYGLCRLCNKVHGKRRFLIGTITGPGKYIDKIIARDTSDVWLCRPDGIIYTPEWRKKQSEILKIACIGKKTTGYFGNHNWINGRRPNKSESKINDWIQEARLPFIFTGDKIIPVVNISPDWTHISKKQVIEFDCRFWHQNGDVQRDNIYKESGFKLLKLNEDDLKDRESTISKIRVFENE
jgi:very-short-patch-repair endonuclease